MRLGKQRARGFVRDDAQDIVTGAPEAPSERAVERSPAPPAPPQPDPDPAGAR